MYKRTIDLSEWRRGSVFFWGPRQTGKSTLLTKLYPDAPFYDLLLSTTYRRLVSNPAIIREECEAANLVGATQKRPVIIDEVQKIPELLDEIHWLIERRKLRFILCGSSPRKLMRSHANLLGGRASRRELFPLTYNEIPGFDLQRALNNGLLPRHYTSETPRELLQAYVGDYLKEEIAAEALSRNIPAFSRFLETAALSNGELVNYHNIARECAVSLPTVKAYFSILEDTLIGRMIPAFLKRSRRRVIMAPKFYFCDVGVVAELARRGRVEKGSELFGRAFEHFIVMEVVAHSSYSRIGYPVSYWRTASQFEVDLILGDGEAAVEVKTTEAADDRHLKGLRAFGEDHPSTRRILVSLDAKRRTTSDGILIMPWSEFLQALWSGGIMK